MIDDINKVEKMNKGREGYCMLLLLPLNLVRQIHEAAQQLSSQVETFQRQIHRYPFC